MHKLKGPVRCTISKAQHTVYSVSQKLLAFGALLERQGAECDGYVELVGLGIALRESAEELTEVWRQVDQWAIEGRTSEA